jgi:outer membrane protein assembly factor BamB
MKLAAILLTAMVGLLLLAGPAGAALCDKCKDMMYTADIGKCVECGGTTSSGAFKLCKACSEKLGQCEHCRMALKASMPEAAAAAKAEAAAKDAAAQTDAAAKAAATKDEAAQADAAAKSDPALAAGDNWPQFRGPTEMGLSTEKNLPLQWSGDDSKNVLWKSPLKGNGHASPIIWGDKIFITTVSWADTVEQNQRGDVMPDHHVLCYRLSDGKLLWDKSVQPGPWKRNDFRSGPSGSYACPTPATDGKLVYVAFGSSVIAAMDFDGNIVWRKEIAPHDFDVTLAASPILFRDTVLMLCSMQDPTHSRVVAYDKATGDVKWEGKMPTMGFGHTTPLLVEVNGKPQLLCLASANKPSNDALQSMDATTGKVLWTCKGQGGIATPVYANGLVYFDSSRGGTGYVVDPTGSGDVSTTHIRASIPIGSAFGSPVVVGKYMYRLDNEGILKCWEMATGTKVYEQKLDGLGKFWGSPVVDGQGRIYFATAGKSYVIQSGPEFKVLGTSDLGELNHPSPAIAQGKMVLVGLSNIYCIGSK